MKKAMKQGDNFSPLLFNIIVNRMKKSTVKKTETLQTIIENQNLVLIRMKGLYADDIAMMADTADKIQRILKVLSEEIDKAKIEINTQKKTTIINVRRTEQIDNIKIYYKGQALEDVTTYDMRYDNKWRKSECRNSKYKWESKWDLLSMNKTILG